MLEILVAENTYITLCAHLSFVFIDMNLLPTQKRKGEMK